jgi:N-acyl-D-amino-acid deacylase
LRQECGFEVISYIYKVIKSSRVLNQELPTKPMKYPFFLLLKSFSMLIPLSVQSEQNEAIGLAIHLVSLSAKAYTEKQDCISCHHQSLPVMALAHAKSSGYNISNDFISGQNLYIQDYFQSRINRMMEGKGVIGGPYTAGYALLQMAVASERNDETIEALRTYLLKTQKPDGSWQIRTHRPPLEDSDFTATALAIRGLKHYGSEKVAIDSAVQWLNDTQPKSTEDHVFQVLGLHWANKESSKAAKSLLSLQQKDHGWAQLPEMQSDAYATGQALFALQESGFLKDDSTKISAGKQWLLNNQKPDGSWHVKSRSRPIQRYFESGFPHGKDQFISISATCWAIMALAERETD